MIRVFAIALCFLGGGGAGFSASRLLAPSGDCGRFFLGLSRLVLLQSVSVESRTESEKVQGRGRFGRANVPNLDVVTLDHVAHLLVREQLGNLDDVVVVLLGSVRELFPVLLVPRDVPERAERDFAEGEDRLGHVAFLRLEEHQSSVQGVDACRVVHRHLSNALEQLGDWRGVVAISEKGIFLTKGSSPSLTRLVTVLVGRSPNDVDSVIFASRRSFDDWSGAKKPRQFSKTLCTEKMNRSELRTLRPSRLVAVSLCDRSRRSTPLRLEVLARFGRCELLVRDGVPLGHDALELVAETLRTEHRQRRALGCEAVKSRDSLSMRAGGASRAGLCFENSSRSKSASHGFLARQRTHDIVRVRVHA